MEKTNYKNHSKFMLVLCAVTCMKPVELLTNSAEAWEVINDPEWTPVFEELSKKSYPELVGMLEGREEEHERKLVNIANTVKDLVVGCSDEEVFEIFNEIKAQKERVKEAQYKWCNNIVKQLNEDRKRQRELGFYDEDPIATVEVDMVTGEEKVVKGGPMPS